MGVVYLARRVDSVGEQVAVKVLHKPLERRRFELEARVIQRLTSPFTVKLIEFGLTAEGTPFIVMERLEGRTLDDAFRAGDLDTTRIIEILRDIARALEEAHALGLIHRDLKPSNVFLHKVATREHVKVLDFGIVKVLQPQELGTEDGWALTVDGSVLGTPPFMSPEQLRRDTLTPQSDLYSLGIIGYRALAGFVPFRDPDPVKVMWAHIQDDPPPLDGGDDPMRRALATLIEQLLVKEPAARPASASNVADSLEHMLGRVRADAILPVQDRSPVGVPTPLLGTQTAGRQTHSSARGRTQPDASGSSGRIVERAASGARARRRWALLPLAIPVGLALGLAVRFVSGAERLWRAPRPNTVALEPSVNEADGGAVALDASPARAAPVRARRRASTRPRPPATRTCRIARVTPAFFGVTEAEAEVVVEPLRASVARCASAKAGVAERIDVRLRWKRGQVRWTAKLEPESQATVSAFIACLDRAPLGKVEWPDRERGYVAIGLECRPDGTGRSTRKAQ